MSRGGTLLRNYPLPPNQGPQCQTTSWQPASSLTHGARGQLRIRESCGSPWTIPPSSSTKPNWCRSVTNCCLSLREGVVENVRLEKLTHSFRHCNPLSHRSSADKHHGTDLRKRKDKSAGKTYPTRNSTTRCFSSVTLTRLQDRWGQFPLFFSKY